MTKNTASVTATGPSPALLTKNKLVVKHGQLLEGIEISQECAHPQKMFLDLKLLCLLLMGPTVGFDTKQRNSFLIKFGVF